MPGAYQHEVMPVTLASNSFRGCGLYWVFPGIVIGEIMRKCEEGVSPVVGVMLMLVITIIIAAVVSGFAGQLSGNAKSAPGVTMDISIKNTGLSSTSAFVANVLSVTEPIPTKDMKLTTTWSKGGKTHTTVSDGSSNVFGWTAGGSMSVSPAVAPWGYGYGVNEVNTGVPNKLAQQFGNYTLEAGTVIKAMPAGQSGGFGGGADTSGYGLDKAYAYKDWTYSADSKVDGMQAVLGNGWEELRTGDVVKVSFFHVPSGKIILEKDVVVQ